MSGIEEHKRPSNAEESPRIVVDVIPAGPADQPILANLLELYSHDFSEFMELRLGPDGRFGYPPLPSYWQDPRRHPFLIRADGELAGFVFVTRGSRVSADPEVWDMAEFFVVRRYRGRRIGSRAPREIWARFPGSWEVRAMESNEAAAGFWRAAALAFAGPGVVERIVVVDEKEWRLFSFTSRVPAQ